MVTVNYLLMAKIAYTLLSKKVVMRRVREKERRVAGKVIIVNVGV